MAETPHLASADATPPDPPPSRKVRRAGRVVALAGAIGVAAQFLFVDVGLGLNFPILVALLLTAAWLSRPTGPRLDPLDAWLAPTALVFAAFVAVRADPTIATLDVFTALALTGAAAASLAGRPIVRSDAVTVVRSGVTTVGWVGGGAMPAMRAARHAMPAGALHPNRARPALPVLRGLALAGPVVLVFVGLFASADAVFARGLELLVDIDFDLGSLPARAVVAGAVAWAACGLLALIAASPLRRTPTSPSTAGVTGPGWRLGTTEATIVLVAVNAVFAVFVVLQAAYLFGGLDTLEAVGLTYAEYARRGFFELVTAAMLAIGLVVVADRSARSRSAPVVIAGVVLTGLTAIVLGSAWLRLQLYQEAYGWTELRLYVLATIVLLAAVLVGLAVALLADRVRWIGHMTVIAALAVGIGLNVLGPVRFITEQNVARLVQPSSVPEHGWDGLDAVYLASLGDDAVPGILRALPHLDDDRADAVRWQLAHRLDELRTSSGLQAWQAWNAGRAVARIALEATDDAGLLDS